MYQLFHFDDLSFIRNTKVRQLRAPEVLEAGEEPVPSVSELLEAVILEGDGLHPLNLRLAELVLLQGLDVLHGRAGGDLGSSLWDLIWIWTRACDFR